MKRNHCRIYLPISKETMNSKIYLVAHDWGGPVAYSYAAAHPQDVKKWLYWIHHCQLLD